MTGPEGALGQPGQLGDPGFTGASGVPGTRGQTGATGITGQPGDRGQQGQRGQSGSPGISIYWLTIIIIVVSSCVFLLQNVDMPLASALTINCHTGLCFYDSAEYRVQADMRDFSTLAFLSHSVNLLVIVKFVWLSLSGTICHSTSRLQNLCLSSAVASRLISLSAAFRDTLTVVVPEK